MENILESEIVKLRPPEPEDLENLYLWENATEFWQVGNTLIPFSKYILGKYIETIDNNIYEARQLRLMIHLQNDDTAIGCVDLFEFDPLHLRAGVGILVADSRYRHKGYASDALHIICNYAFSVLLLNQIFCNITTDNISSIRLFERAGFEQTGTRRQWYRSTTGWKDEIIMQKFTPFKI